MTEKQKYMVTLSFPPYLTEDFVALIPRQRAMIVDLLSEGKLVSFSLNANRTHSWMVFNARNEGEVEEILEQFPMYDYFQYELENLIVYDTAFMGLPKVVLN